MHDGLEGIKKNFDRILNNRKIKIGTKNLDSIEVFGII